MKSTFQFVASRVNHKLMGQDAISALCDMSVEPNYQEFVQKNITDFLGRTPPYLTMTRAHPHLT